MVKVYPLFEEKYEIGNVFKHNVNFNPVKVYQNFRLPTTDCKTL